MENKLASLEESTWKRILNQLIEIDPRSLALFRMALAATALACIVVYWGDIDAFFADDGMVSASLSKEYYRSDWTWSLFYLNDSIEYKRSLFLVASAAATAMFFGLGTRLATIITWALVVSLIHRSPLTANGGEILIRVLLFWAMFLPTGRRWSIDSLIVKDSPPRDQPVRSMATAAVLLQMAMFYSVSGAAKLNEEWFAGRAVESALQLDIYGKSFGRFLLGYPQLLSLLTWGTLALELSAGFLIFFPWHTKRIRMALVGILILFHGGLYLSMTLGLFQHVCIAAACLLLPSTFWELRFVSAVTRRLGGGSQEIQKAEGASEPERYLPSSLQRVCRWGSSVICGLMLLHVIQWNVATLSDLNVPKSCSWLGRTTGLRQRWMMFVRPNKNDGWFVARTRLADGRIVDLLRQGEEISYDKPEDIAGLFPNHHWRHHVYVLTSKKGMAFREPAARYLARRWNEQHEEEQQVVKIELLFFLEPTRDDFKAGDYVTRILAHIDFDDSVSSGNFSEAFSDLENDGSFLP